MKEKRNESLRWALMKRLFALQAFLLVLFVILLVGWIWIIDPRLEAPMKRLFGLLRKA